MIDRLVKSKPVKIDDQDRSLEAWSKVILGDRYGKSAGYELLMHPKYECDITYQDFGIDLLSTFDLDPLYPMVLRVGLDERTLKRWLLAYWCYYAAGAASYIAEQKDFYRAMYDGIPKYPRGHERRHFRGDAAMRGIAGLQSFGSPERVVDAMICHNSFQAISRAAQSFPQFGPWIAWKIADMTERVLCQPVDFGDAELGVYRDPVKGAALLWYGDQHHEIDMDTLHEVVELSLGLFADYMAPPFLDRPVNIQEIETILCKFKSHYNGHYPLGNDSYEIAHGLQGWGDLAQHMYQCLKLSTSYEV